MHVEARGWCRMSSIMFYLPPQFMNATLSSSAWLAGPQASQHWGYRGAPGQFMQMLRIKLLPSCLQGEYLTTCHLPGSQCHLLFEACRSTAFGWVMLGILHYGLLSCLYKIYSNIPYITSMNSKGVQATLTLPSLQHQFLSVRPCLKKPNQCRHYPQKEMKTLENRCTLQLTYPGVRKGPHFPTIEKQRRLWGGVFTAHVPTLQHPVKGLPGYWFFFSQQFPLVIGWNLHLYIRLLKTGVNRCWLTIPKQPYSNAGDYKRATRNAVMRGSCPISLAANSIGGKSRQGRPLFIPGDSFLWDTTKRMRVEVWG